MKDFDKDDQNQKKGQDHYNPVNRKKIHINSGWWICADDPTRRRFFLYDMRVLLFLFCFCSASKWRTSKDIRGS